MHNTPHADATDTLNANASDTRDDNNADNNDDNGDDNNGDDDRARRRLGAALRTLQHRVVGRTIDPETIHRIAEQLEDVNGDLDAHAPRRRPPSTWASLVEVTIPHDGQTLDPGYGDRPFSGWSSPFSLEMDVVRNGDEVVTEVTLQTAHEGAPGRSHGGIVAALFDDLTGFVLQITAARAYTGELKVRYEAPVPLGVPLAARAYLRGREGRKLFIDGELHHGTQRLATVQTIYVIAPDVG